MAHSFAVGNLVKSFSLLKTKIMIKEDLKKFCCQL